MPRPEGMVPIFLLRIVVGEVRRTFGVVVRSGSSVGHTLTKGLIDPGLVCPRGQGTRQVGG